MGDPRKQPDAGHNLPDLKDDVETNAALDEFEAALAEVDKEIEGGAAAPSAAAVPESTDPEIIAAGLHGAPPMSASVRTMPQRAPAAPVKREETIGDWLTDIGRGMGQGLTSRWGDEISSAMVPEIDDGTGIPREYAEGSANAAMRADMRRGLAESQERSPWLYGGGEVVGGALQSAPLAAIGAPATTLGKVAMNTALGAGQGALVGSGGAAEGQKLAGAKQGAAVGALGGAAITAGAAGAANLARKAAPWMAKQAALKRFGATGPFAGQVDALRRDKGDDFLVALGEHAERMKAETPGIKSYLPWNARDYQSAAAKSHGDLGEQIGQQLSDAEAAGVLVPGEDVATRMEQTARGYGGAVGTRAGDTQAAALRAEAQRLLGPEAPRLVAAGRGGAGAVDDLIPSANIERDALGTPLAPRSPAPPNASAPADVRTVGKPLPMDPLTMMPSSGPVSLTPRQAMAQKQAYERLAGYRGDKIATLPTGSTPEMYGDAADAMRGGLYDAMDPSPVGPAFRQSMSDFGKTNTILNAASKRVAHDEGNQLVSLPSAVLASGGLASDVVTGGMAGAGMGLMKGYGKDVAAAGYKAGANIASGVPAAAAVGANPLVQSTALRAPMMQAASAAAEDSSKPTDDPNSRADIAAWLNTNAPTSRNVDEAVSEIAETNPALLGEYGPRLAAAQQKSDEHYAAEFARAMEQDPEFQQALREFTNARNGER